MVDFYASSTPLSPIILALKDFIETNKSTLNPVKGRHGGKGNREIGRRGEYRHMLQS